MLAYEVSFATGRSWQAPLKALLIPLRAPPLGRSWQHSFARSSFEGVSPHHAFARCPNVPVSFAPQAFGAERVSRRDFRASGGDGEPETPPEGAPFAAWRSPPRPVKNGQRLSRMGVRLAPQDNGRRADDIAPPPPSLFSVGVREIPDIPPLPGQAGYPATLTPAEATPQLGATLPNCLRVL